MFEILHELHLTEMLVLKHFDSTYDKSFVKDGHF